MSPKSGGGESLRIGLCLWIQQPRICRRTPSKNLANRQAKALPARSAISRTERPCRFRFLIVTDPRQLPQVRPSLAHSRPRGRHRHRRPRPGSKAIVAAGCSEAQCRALGVFARSRAW